MISLQQDYITNETMDNAYQSPSLRDDLRSLVLSGISGLSTLSQTTQVAPRDYEPYRTTDFPDVLSIPLTDKLAPFYAPTSNGKKPKGEISLPYIVDSNRGWQYKDSQQSPPDILVAESPAKAYAGTVLTNPVALSFETVPVYSGSALEANYQQLPATLSGQDSMLVPLMSNLSQQSANASVDDSQQLSTSTTAKECWIPGVISGCWIRKDVRNETVVFIVGAIVLALGIFALTR